MASQEERVHRSSDGTLRKFDSTTKKWTVVEENTGPTPQRQKNSCCDGAKPSGYSDGDCQIKSKNVEAEKPLAIEWRSFEVGKDFRINGWPIVVEEIKTDSVESRARENQESHDTGRHVWDGSVVLAKYLES